jgi:hypothetical protein
MPTRPALSPKTWLMLVLAVAVLVRAGLWLTYPLTETNDTPTYRHLARSLTNKGFESYNGMRTPGYPLFVALTGSDAGLYAVQLLLGVLTTLVIFFLAWKLSGKAWFGGALALAHTLNMGQVFFEASFLSEALSTFLLFLVFAGLFYLFDPQSSRFYFAIALGIGLAAAILAMTRPLFVFVPFWGALFLAFFSKAPFKTRWAAAILTALPAVITLAVWVGYIYTNFKILSLDSMGGYHMVNHVTSFFELAPDQYAPIRDTFLEFRAARLAESGDSVNTIWDAIPALMEQTGYNYYRLARVMGDISSQLIAQNPDKYAWNLILGWLWFWKAPIYWDSSQFAPALASVMQILALAERGLLILANLIFLFASLLLFLPRFRARLQPNLFIYFAASAIWVTSILQTLAEHGDNPRFLVPLQTLIVILVAWGALRLYETLEKPST